MRTLAFAALIVGLATAKPGPDTALRLGLEPGPFRDLQVVVLESCPPQFRLGMTLDLPDPGWELEVDEVTAPDAEGRRVVRLTAHRKEGLWPQVVTERTVHVSLGSVRKGVHLLDVFLRRDRAAKHERVQAVVLRGE